MTAVLGMGLAITSCSTPGSSDVETLASTTPSTGRPLAGAAPTEPPSAPVGALVVDVGGGKDADSGATSGSDSTAAITAAADPTSASSTTAVQQQTTTTGSLTTPTSTATTATATTATTQRSTTTARPTTQGPTTTTTASSAAETRPELLRLALPTFGGGTFDPDSMAGKNVILWFWGAH